MAIIRSQGEADIESIDRHFRFWAQNRRRVHGLAPGQT